MVRKLPEKWEEFSNFGTIIPGTNIIASKVPLKDDYYFPEQREDGKTVEKYTPQIMKEQIEGKFNKRIGLVIDLTDTQNYYMQKQICFIFSDYYKLRIKGQMMPYECYVQQFIKVIDQFNAFIKEGGNPDQFTPRPEPEKMQEDPVKSGTEENVLDPAKSESERDEKDEKKSEEVAENVSAPKDENSNSKKEDSAEEIEKKTADQFFSAFLPENLPDLSGATVPELSPQEAKKYSNEMENSEYLIVVHCTHGMNRSGYMISRFLIDRMGMNNKDVIKMVGEARGHDISREQFLYTLNDPEIIAMARDQCKYRFLSDSFKLSKTPYQPGQKFLSPDYKIMRETEWKRLHDATIEETRTADEEQA